MQARFLFYLRRAKLWFENLGFAIGN